MKLKLAILSVCIATLTWGDQITLKNGDRLSGTIVKKDGADLTLKGTPAGTVTVPWNQVTAIASDAAVTVVLAGDKTVQTPLSTNGDRVMVQGQSISFGDIVAIRNADEQAEFERHVHPAWSRLWTGTATLALAGTQGNAETKTFVTAVSAARLTNNDKTTIYFNAIKSSATLSGVDGDTAKAVRGGWSYSHNLSPRIFASVFNDYEYDAFQDLDLRFVIGGGAGYHLWKNAKGQLDLVAGFDYDRDKFGSVINTPPTPNVASYTNSRGELYYGDDFTYKLNGSTSLTQSARMFHDLSDFGNYRINFDLGANTKLTKWLTWNVALSDRYLAIPVTGRVPNDFIYSTGIGVTFAH